jgi:hypothetical protein
MSDAANTVDAGTKYCQKCSEELFEEAEICPECGVRQPDVTAGAAAPAEKSGSWVDQYSMLTWVGAVVFALLTFPVGLLIPGYFFIKAKGDEPPNQGRWEVVTAILFGIIGIAAVEIGGEKGAKALWAISVGLFIVFATVGMWTLSLA